jgi:hypothetical protein
MRRLAAVEGNGPPSYRGSKLYRELLSPFFMCAQQNAVDAFISCRSSAPQLYLRQSKIACFFRILEAAIPHISKTVPHAEMLT